MKRIFTLLMLLALVIPSFAEDIIYCRGGLVGVGDWAQSTLYPLRKNADGIFEGTVNMVARTECTDKPTLGYGNRVDLFFDFNNTNNTWSCNGAQVFITPGNPGPHKLTSGTGKPFQCGGGEYKVLLDWDKKEVTFEAIEPAWLEHVMAVGDLAGAHWDRLGDQYQLEHKGDGIYKGEIEVEEGDQKDGMGYFSVFAAYVSNWTEGRYTCASTHEILPGVIESVSRYNGDRNFGLRPGTYTITFDMNHSTLRVNTTDEPDLIQSKAHAELGIALEAAEEAWEKVDFSAIRAIYENAESTDDEQVAAKEQISTLIRSYVIAQMEGRATYDDPIDATYLIRNADYSTDYKQGWSGTTVKVQSGVMSAENTDLNHHQKLTAIPSGVYKVSVQGAQRYGNIAEYYNHAGRIAHSKHAAKQFVTTSGITSTATYTDLYDEQLDALLIDGEQDPTGQGWYMPVNASAAHEYMNDDRYADNVVYAYVDETQNMDLGLRLENHAAGSWLFADNWTLTYYGNTAQSFSILTDAVKESVAELSDLPAEGTLREGLGLLLEKASAETPEEMRQAYTDIVKAREALEQSITLYDIYKQKVDAALKDLNENHSDLSGVAAKAYRAYLTEEEEPGRFPNGSALYILGNGNVAGDKLEAEAAYIGNLLEEALRGSIAAGTDITTLFTNMNFTEADFNGWEMTVDNVSGSYSPSHGTKAFPVAGFFNVNSFEVKQTLTDLPNGIYALTFNGYFRTGAPGMGTAEDFMPAFAFVGDIQTPVMNIVEDALLDSEAQEGVNCAASDYRSGDGTRYPDQADGASIAFANGRYQQTVYGLVKDGTLTIGIRQTDFPDYDRDWCVFGGMNVKYLGTDDAVAEAMLVAQQKRAEELVASYYFMRNGMRDNLIATLEGDAADKAGKAEALNAACAEATYSAACYSKLEKAVILLNEKAVNAGSKLTPEMQDRYNSIFNDTYEKLDAGTYSDEEALKLAADYTSLALDLVPIMAKGGLQDVGNWGDNDVYLLYRNSEGIYEGVIKVVDSSDLSESNSWWGNRGDIFFKDSKGKNWSCGRPADKFITPATTQAIPLVEGTGCVFQAIGGDYRVLIDWEKKEVTFKPEREFYLDHVYCIGTIEGHNPFWNRRNTSTTLQHAGNGVYKGIVTIAPASEGELGEFAIRASYNSGDNEGTYGTPLNPELKVGVPQKAIRTNSSESKWLVQPGQWHITFDMNNFSVRLNTVDNPDYIEGEGGEEEDKIPVYVCGGLQDVGNWASNTKYPLYKNKEGIYEGNFTISDLNLVMMNNGNANESRYGQRGDIFFEDVTGQRYSAAGGFTIDDRFLTPARVKGKKFPMALGTSNVFQAHGGTWHVKLNLDKMEVEFECVEEKWMDEIYVGGTIVGHRWSNSVAADRSNVLKHQGNGIYQGVMNLEEDNSTRGTFYVQTSYGSGNDGRYSPLKDKEICQTDGTPMQLYRTNNNSLSISTQVGTWIVRFDWSRCTVQLVDVNDEDGIHEIGLSNVDKTRQVGIYTLDGKKVYNGIGFWTSAKPGIYIQVSDSEVKKVLVK